MPRDDHQRRCAGGRQPERPHRRRTRADPAAGLPAHRKARPSEPRAHSRAGGARQGLGRVRNIHRQPRHLALHPGQGPPARREVRCAGPVLHRGRRARGGGRRARRARLRGEVLHRGGQLGSGREQHPGLFHPRPLQVPGLHPYPETASEDAPAEPRGHVGLLVAVAGVAAPDHHPDVGSRLPHGAHVHERLRVPHLQLHQRGQRALLGEVPLQDPAGAPALHQRGKRRGHRADPGVLPGGPVRGHRGGRVPEVGPQGADHAGRGRGENAVQPLRPHQGLAPRRLPA